MDNQTEKLEMNQVSPDQSDHIRTPQCERKLDESGSQCERELGETKCKCPKCKQERQRAKTRQLIIQCFDLLSEEKYEEYNSILNEHPHLYKKMRFVVKTEICENDEIIKKTEKILKNARDFAKTLDKMSLFLFKE